MFIHPSTSRYYYSYIYSFIHSFDRSIIYLSTLPGKKGGRQTQSVGGRSNNKRRGNPHTDVHTHRIQGPDAHKLEPIVHTQTHIQQRPHTHTHTHKEHTQPPEWQLEQHMKTNTWKPPREDGGVLLPLPLYPSTPPLSHTPLVESWSQSSSSPLTRILAQSHSHACMHETD
eukprot:GHVU01097362.1.p1 GENE.GHVU01097362.1~~GHVU01097362.1.p1  ORF type:complete len:171 (+),score=13.19 GHVU01097362.1:102-614(+)